MSRREMHVGAAESVVKIQSGNRYEHFVESARGTDAAPEDARAVDLLGLGNRDNAGDAGVFEEAAEMGVLPVGGARGDPGDGQG